MRIFKSKVCDIVISRNVILAESPGYRKPAVLYAPNSTGAQGYFALANGNCIEGFYGYS